MVHASGWTLSPCSPKSLWAWWLHTVELPWPFWLFVSLPWSWVEEGQDPGP